MDKFEDNQRDIRIDDFVESTDGTIYAGIICHPPDKYGIIASCDQGTTWETMYVGQTNPARPENEPYFVFLAIFNDELYVSMGYKNEGKLYKASLSTAPNPENPEFPPWIITEPDPEIPEFPSWVIPPSFLIATLFVIVYRKRLQKKMAR